MIARSNVNAIESPMLREIALRAIDMDYTLPGSKDDVHVLGFSGGADSSVNVVVMTTLFPETTFKVMFSDTGAESEGTLSSIQRMEKFIGHPIDIRQNDADLWGILEANGGYLPAQRARWCTRQLKIEVMAEYMDEIRQSEEHIYQYVGLRADEPMRKGMEHAEGWRHTIFPLRDLGLDKDQVFRVLEETMQVPSFYKWRSRSGCHICPFSRKQEYIAACQADYQTFLKAEAYETLTDGEKARHALKQDGDWSPRPIDLPVPEALDCRKDAEGGKTHRLAIRNKQGEDLFGANTYLHVAVEYLIDPMINLFGKPAGAGVYHANIITWGTDRAGLDKALKYNYWSRCDASYAHGLTEDEFVQGYRMAIYHLEIPSDLIDLTNHFDGYTWKSGVSLLQIRQIIDQVKRTLYVAAMEQEMIEYAGAKEDTWGMEYREGLEGQLAAVNFRYGKVLGAEVVPHPASRPVESAEERACPVCSI